MAEKINFTKTQTRLLNELKTKFQQAWTGELNGALAVIYDELGLTEKLKDGKHRFTLLTDFTGVNIQKISPDPTIPGRKMKKAKGKK